MEIDKFEYHINDKSEITNAILPINKIIDKANINNIMNEFTGGDIQLESNHPRFEGLGVPVGLIVSKHHKDILASKQQKVKEISCKVMDEEDYEKLLNKIAKKRDKKGKKNGKTKKLKKLKMKRRSQKISYKK